MSEGEPRPVAAVGPGALGVAGLLGVAAVLQLVWLVGGWAGPAHAIRYDALPQEDADMLVTVALTIACAVLALRARGREFGLCVTVYLGAALVASIEDFRPSTFLGPNGGSLQSLFVLALVCTGAAAVLSILLLRRRSPEEAGRATGDRAAARRRRTVVLGFGLPALALGTVSAFFDAGSVRYGPLSAGASDSCCAVQRLDHWYQAGFALSTLTVAAFVSLAAFSRSPARATAWLAAPALCGLGDAAWFTASKLWPAASVAGIGRTSLLDGVTFYTLEPGYWLSLLTLAVFAAGALLVPQGAEARPADAVNAASA